MLGYNFTERVRTVLTLARDEAVELGSSEVEPTHILLGLLHENHGNGVAVLKRLGVSVPQLAAELSVSAKVSYASPTAGSDLPYSAEGKEVLHLATASAQELDHHYVGTEHLVLGLLRIKKGEARVALNAAGVTYDAARAQLLQIHGEAAARDAHITDQADGAPDDHDADTLPTGLTTPVKGVTVVLHGNGMPIARDFPEPGAAMAFLRRYEHGGG